MERKYIKLVHNTPEHANWFVVNWCLGNTCNYACSYCPAELHDGTVIWPEREKVKNFIRNVKEHNPTKQIYFEFTGGEVTLYRHFSEIAAYCTELGIRVGLISNGSRTIRWWEEHKKYFDHICLSFHPEHANKDHFLNVVSAVHMDLRTHVNIMMDPKSFDSCYEYAKQVAEIGNISMALQPLIVNFGDQLYPYSSKQSELINRQINGIVYTKRFPYYRGSMAKVFEDGTQETVATQKFMVDGANNWSGWQCSAGVEQLVVDMDGGIHRGWCKVGDTIGSIFDDELTLPLTYITCDKTMCHCNFDVTCTKYELQCD